MTFVDQAVLRVVERMCRRFQTWTGRTNVWLAFQFTNLSVIVYFVWVATLYWVSGSLAVRTFVAIFCGGVLWMLSRTIFRMSVDAAEAQAYARVAKGLANPRQIRDAQLRIAFLTLSVLLSYPLWLAYSRLHVRWVLLTEALIVLTTAVLYLLACDPLPPVAAKVAVWRRALAPVASANVSTVSQRAELASRPRTCVR